MFLSPTHRQRGYAETLDEFSGPHVAKVAYERSGSRVDIRQHSSVAEVVKTFAFSVAEVA